METESEKYPFQKDSGFSTEHGALKELELLPRLFNTLLYQPMTDKTQMCLLVYIKSNDGALLRFKCAMHKNTSLTKFKGIETENSPRKHHPSPAVPEHPVG